jgi:hypothetical protein
MSVGPLPFTPVSHLTLSGSFFDGPVLRGFNMGALSSLTLAAGDKLGPVGFTALGQATGLTYLYMYISKRVSVALDLVLSRMSRLRFLSLDTKVFTSTYCFNAIGLLTALTRLEWEGGDVTRAALEVCLVLRELRVLSILPDSLAGYACITPKMGLALAKLPELTKFVMRASCASRAGGLTIRASVNVERRSKGRPPLTLALVDNYWCSVEEEDKDEEEEAEEEMEEKYEYSQEEEEEDEEEEEEDETGEGEGVAEGEEE